MKKCPVNPMYQIGCILKRKGLVQYTRSAVESAKYAAW